MTSPNPPGALPEHISLATIIPAIERALAEGRLAAQQRPELALTCLYSYPDEPGLPPGCGCAIGVALSTEARALLARDGRNNMPVDNAKLNGIFTIPPEEEISIAWIQGLHDQVVQGRQTLEHFIEDVAGIARALGLPFAPCGASASEPQP